MSNLERRTVVACITAVIGAYRDGRNILNRVKDRRRASGSGINPVETQQLEASLELGPVMIQGQYDHDIRRFGDAYARGDPAAREQIKDVLITMQMEIISTLNRAHDTGADLDFFELQQVSDECRVNAVVCLGQLYQRLAQPFLPMQGAAAHHGHLGFSASPPSYKGYEERADANGLAYGLPLSPPQSTSSSPSSHTSYPLDIVTSHMSELELSPSGVRRNPSAYDSPEDFLRHRNAESSLTLEARKRRTASSFGAIPSMADFPTPSCSSSSPTDDRFDDTPSSFRNQPPTAPPQRHPDHDLSRHQRGWISASSNEWSQPTSSNVRVYENPDDFGPVSPYRQDPRVPFESHSSAFRQQYPPRNQSRLGPEPSNYPRIAPRSSSVHPPHSPIPVSDGVGPVGTVGHGDRYPERQSSQTLGTALTRTSTTRSQFLTFPSETNGYGGFCQGAWRLQIGDNKKAFAVNQRPVGMTSTIPFWKCKKCDFEGPVVGGSSKSNQTFDRKVRRSAGGIQYRWSFLAKCHIQNKKAAPQNITDGSFGTFGCIFCFSEGMSGSDNLSVHSGSSNGQQSNKGRKMFRSSSSSHGAVPATTPVFGNVQSFMEHLEEHRQEGREPPSALLERTKCIIARVAGADEEFDINLPPLKLRELA